VPTIKRACSKRKRNAEQTRQLLQRAKEGDLEARNHLIEENRGLCYKIATKYANPSLGFEVEELAQEGVLGLFHAIEGFDLTRTTAFSTYAWFWIRQHIQRFCERNESVIHVPKEAKSKSQALLGRFESLRDEGDHTVSIEEVAAKLKIRKERIFDLLSIPQKVYSLDYPVGERQDDLFLDRLPGTRDVYDLKLRTSWNRVLSCLTPIEQDVVKRRLGYPDGEIQTLAEVGKIYGHSRQWANLTYYKSVKKMKEFVRSQTIRYQDILED
jgi:RNA polymerase sigma factor (sigma-70 family)